MMIATTLARFAVAAILVVVLAACSSTRLSDGLTQRMDSGTAQLNSAEAIGIINHYRSTVGVGPLMEDPALSAQANLMARLLAADVEHLVFFGDRISQLQQQRTFTNARLPSDQRWF